MSARDARDLLACIEGAGVGVWLDGGWAVDAALQTQTRPHDGLDVIYPAAGFRGTGSVLGRQVRCLTPAVQILCHTGYEPHRKSYDDVTALGRRFGLPVPEEYRRDRESYPLRSE